MTQKVSNHGLGSRTLDGLCQQLLSVATRNAVLRRTSGSKNKAKKGKLKLLFVLCHFVS